MGNLPIARSVKISFIRPFTLTNFVEKYHDLENKFNFLANSNNYSEYYESEELKKGSTEQKLRPREIVRLDEIDFLKFLVPLSKKHRLNGYWKCFLLPLKKEEDKINKEIFLLLPLKINIPITSIRADNTKFPIKLYAYLFPFGSCCVNMEVKISESNYSLDKLPKLISDIRISNFSEEKKSFESFSFDIAKKINKTIFNDEENIVKNSVHTFIFLDTSEFLSLDDLDHKRAIVATMMRRSIEDVSTLAEEKLNEITRCKLKKYRFDEILIFNPQCTFIYPSHIWVGKKNEDPKIAKKIGCMHNNYCSFLNVTFAINRFLADSFLKNRDTLPEMRALEIAECFTKAFPETPQGEYNNIYFNMLFDQIASEIKLNERLKELKERENT